MKWIINAVLYILKLAFLLVFFIFLVFITLYSKGHNDILSERWELSNNKKTGFVADKRMMYRPKPNADYRWSELTKSDADSVKRVTIDSLYRRITPWSPIKKEHLIFFGCSYIYGDGLSNEFTIPYQFGMLDSIYNPYNYAASGYGTSHMLEILKKGIYDEIPEEKGIGIYCFIDHHRDRITNDPYTLIWGYDFPKYSLNANLQLQYEGSFFETDRISTQFYKGFGDWNLWKPYIIFNEKRKKKAKGLSEKQSSDIKSLPFHFVNDVAIKDHNDSKYLLMSKIIKASETLYYQQFPYGKFFVLIMPGEKENIVPFLEYENIPLINLSKSLDLDAIKGHQADGYHPNEIGATEIAKIIHVVIDEYHSANLY